MKLLVDCTPLSVGGGVQVAIALLVNLRARAEIAWQAVIPVAVKPTLPLDVVSDPRVIFVQKNSVLDRIWLRREMLRIEQAFKPDVVFTVFGPAVFRARAPHVVGFALPNLIYARDGPLADHNPMVPMLDWLRCLSLRQADHLVVETDTVRRRLARRLAIDPAKISVIGNALNPLLLKNPPDDVASADRFSILIPSAFYRHKNLGIVPEVAASLRQQDQELAFEFRLTLSPSSPQWLEIKSEGERLGIADRVTTLGVLSLDALARAYHEASAVFLPTLRETSSAVYPESFYFKRPLVTSDMDFARELCGDAALYVPPFDATATAAHLAQMARSPELRARLVAAGDAQLQRAYTRADDKFARQLALLEEVSQDRLFSSVPTHSRHVAVAHAPELAQERGTAATAEDENRVVSFHDAIASSWDAKYQSGRFFRRAEFLKREIMPFVTRQGHWLDAGCGSGYFARLLGGRGMKVTGIDASVPIIQAARELAAKYDLLHLLQFDVMQDLDRLPFADNAFAGCLCLSVLEYLDEPFACLDELARVVEPHGLLVLSVPTRRSPLRSLQQTLLSAHLHKIWWNFEYRNLSKFATTPGELKQAFARRGFALKTIVPFDPLIPTWLARYVPPALLFAIGVKSA